MKPNLIFPIVPSCSGKPLMSQIICSLHHEYSALDDTVPLYKIFNVDELLHKNKLYHFWKFANENGIDTYYDLEDPCFCSYLNPKGGYLIDNPIVWNIVLTILGKQISSEYTVIEFSRGSDLKYNKFFDINDQNVCLMFFNYLCQNILSYLLKYSLIINIDVPLEIRKKRNVNRAKNRECLVSKKIMNSVYKNDVFYSQDNIINIKNVKIPIVYIKNQIDCYNFPSFLQNEFMKALNYKEYHDKI